jgi:hypothetical protein
MNTMRKVISLLFLIAVCGFTQVDPKVHREYVGGRPGFSYARLVLYTDSTYFFHERFDFPGVTKDSGQWKITDHILTLSSATKPRRKRMFDNKSFKIQDGVVYLFDLKQDSTFNKLYRTLREKH